MTRIGITGHQSLQKRLEIQRARHSEADAWRWAEQVFTDLLAETTSGEKTVVSSLAGGADQRLSRVALEQGVGLEVVVPSAGYTEAFDDAADREEYRRILDQAGEVIRLNYSEPSEEAFFAAGKCVVDRSDVIIAVWDGRGAEGLGGTGDIVAYGRSRGRIVWHLDPIRRMISHFPAKE